MADPAPSGTLSPAQIAAANPQGIPQAVDMPGGEPFDLAGSATDPRIAKTIADLKEKYTTNLGELSAGQLEADRRDAQLRARQEAMLDQEGATVADLKGMGTWNADQELAKRKTDLWSQFGSPGFVIGMLASAFTGAPMNSALNAGAAAMNAINQGDMKSYEKAFDAWKTNADLAFKRLDEEHKEYSDIEHLRSSDMAEWRSKMATILAKFGDQRKLALLNNGYDAELYQAIGAEQTSKLNGVKVRDAIDAQNMKIMWINAQPGVWSEKNGKRTANPIAWHKAMQTWDSMGDADKDAYRSFVAETWDREKRSPTSDEILAFQKKQSEAKFPYRGSFGVAEKLQEKTDVKAAVKKEHPEWSPDKVDLEADRRIKAASASPMTGNERYKIQAHLGLYEDAGKLIEGIDTTLNKYVGAAGIAGRATRLAERIRDIGGSHDTDRVQMMRDIEQLQLMAPRLLLDQTTGRPLSAEAGYVETIIAGLSAGDTTANTLRAMKEIKARLEAIEARDRANLPSEGGETKTAPPAAPPVKPNASWDQFPEVK